MGNQDKEIRRAADEVLPVERETKQLGLSSLIGRAAEARGLGSGL